MLNRTYFILVLILSVVCYSAKAASGDDDNDGMPNEWETAHGLDPNNADDAWRDKDDDEFINLEEYYGNSDPGDSSSVPQGSRLGFESGRLDEVYWRNDGEQRWFTTNDKSSLGDFSVSCNSNNCVLSAAVHSNGGYITFDGFVYGYLVFFIDGQRMQPWARRQDSQFTKEVYALSAGWHQVKWSAHTGGGYQAWIDNIFYTGASNIDDDNDEVDDGWEQVWFGNLDTDMSLDNDSDGLANYQEFYSYTNPLDADTDNDGMPDGWEIENGLNPNFDDSSFDVDEDLLTNIDEYWAGTNPNDFSSSKPTKLVNFESEPVSPFYWRSFSTSQWRVAEGMSELGGKSFQAYFPSDAQGDSILTAETEVSVFALDGFIRFDYYAQDAGQGGIHFFIDNEEHILEPSDSYSKSLKRMYFKVTQGTHRLKWTYSTWGANVPYAEAHIDNLFLTGADGVDPNEDGVDDLWAKEYFGQSNVDMSVDPDGDGATNQTEYLRRTNPVEKDGDFDRLDDSWEIEHQLNPFDPQDALIDTDEDGFNNLEEFLAETNPKDASSFPNGNWAEFETDSLDSENFDWSINGDADWSISSNFPSQGDKSLVSGQISQHQFTELVTSVNSYGGYVRFDLATAIEYEDAVEFYIDGILMGSWSYIYNIESRRPKYFTHYYKLYQGQHQLKWRFTRNATYSNMGNQVWLDHVFVTAPISNDTAPPGKVSATVTSSSDTSVLIQWDNYSEEENGADIALYEIYQSSTAFTDISAATKVAETISGVQQSTISNLPTNNTYYFAVVAVDVAGNRDSTVVSQSITLVDTTPPSPVSGIQIVSHSDSIDVSWSASASTDLAGYGVKIGTGNYTQLPNSQTSYTFSGLTPNQKYDVSLEAYDVTGNHSTPSTKAAATLYDNPIIDNLLERDGKVELTWSSTTNIDGIGSYRVFVSESAFNSVANLTPVQYINKSTRTTTVSQLANGTKYYFAVQIQNINGYSSDTVVAGSATPTADKQGPDITSVKIDIDPYEGIPDISVSKVISITATDESGVSRAEFLIDANLVKTDFGSNGSFQYAISPDSLEDGSHTINIRVYDSLDQMSEWSGSFNVLIPLPAAPVITEPVSGTTVANSLIQVVAQSNAEQVQFYLGGQSVTDWLPVQNGQATAQITLVEGENILSAKAKNRAGTGESSTTVSVNLDSSIPEAPAGLIASSNEQGEIKLSWNASLSQDVIGYDVYRSESIFSDLGEATRINPLHLTGTQFTDLPVSDGEYFYAVVAINHLETSSGLSNIASVIADSTPPTANITYEAMGQYDGSRGIYGRGEIKVHIVVSEPLLTTPFLSIKPGSGAIQMLALEKISDLEYVGTLNISDETQTGIAYATFSAIDKSGNQGTEITEGDRITIDSKGPSITKIVLNPGHPIKNEQSAPVTVSVTVYTDEAVAEEKEPVLSYLLSAEGRQSTIVENLTPFNSGRFIWTGSIQLPADAGLDTAEKLTFSWEASDALSNTSEKIVPEQNVQVYQGDLPPLATPFGLQATAQESGKVKLTWYPVEEAVEYQLYRKSPSDTELIPLIRVNPRIVDGVHLYTDQTDIDGTYEYTIASVRNNNGQETLSAQSAPVSVDTDSEKPAAPQNLKLELKPNGIQVSWDPSQSDDVFAYRIYKDEVSPITSTDGLDPAMEDIDASVNAVIDIYPDQTLPAYVVVAVDAAGNQSAPSNTDYLNVELFPVNYISVVQRLNELPEVSWAHDNEQLAGFDLYLGDRDSGFKVNSTPLQNYLWTDTGYNGNDRQYTIVALDSNQTESLPRSINLPKINISLKAGEVIKSHLINEVVFVIKSESAFDIKATRLEFKLDGKIYRSENFDLSAHEQKEISVVVATDTESTGSMGYEVSLISEPDETERMTIVRDGTIDLLPGVLGLRIETADMVRGTAGKVRINVENTGDAMLEIITALSNGAKDSNDIRLIMTDNDDNVIATQSMRQALGDGVLTIASGQTIARIEQQQTWQSEWLNFDIPQAAPEQVNLEVQIDHIYRNLGTGQTVSIAGTSTSTELSLVETEYTGGAVTAEPAVSFGDQDILIEGQAISRIDQSSVSNAPLKVIITVNGFEKSIDVSTDESGQFTYVYTPDGSESGSYKVSVVHPDITERPEDATFVISKVTIKPNDLTVTIPKRYTQELPIKVTAAEGTELTNVRFELREADQPDGTLPADIALDFADAITLKSKEQKSLFVNMTPGDDANDEGIFVLTLLSDQSGDTALGYATVHYVLSAAQPVLYYTPSVVDTGVTLDGQVQESVILENKGVDVLRDVQVSIVRTDGFAAPDWINLAVSADQGDIEVGESRNVGINIQPQNNASPGVHEFRLRVVSGNYPQREIPIFVALTESGEGGYQFKVSDMYTLTPDANGDLIQGLKGATVRIQNEDVPDIEYTLQTNELGEVLFNNIPAGRYSYWASATKHQEAHDRITIRPGVIRNESVFLDYNLINLEWSVQEITIEDRYQVVLTATYEVDVPAAVVVLAPSSAEIPDMEPGDVFYGELTITNHGLIRADSIEYTMPASNEYYQFDFLTSSLPSSLEAKEEKRIPYRITALKSIEPEVDGSGGGCGVQRFRIESKAESTCANGSTSTSNSTTYWTKSYGQCSSGGGGGGGGWVGGGGAGGAGGGGTGGGTAPQPMPACRVDGKQCSAPGNGAGDQ